MTRGGFIETDRRPVAENRRVARRKARRLRVSARAEARSRPSQSLLNGASDLADALFYQKSAPRRHN